MNILNAALGHYEVAGDPADADLVIGNSFGTVISDHGVNAHLADFILRNAEGRAIVADRMLADSFPNGADDVDYVVEGPISNATGHGVGTWGTLVEARAFMTEHDLQRPLMVAQAHHIGRIVMQGKKLGINSIVPADLPAYFDRDSEQLWTRSLGLWVPREVLGSLVLRAQNKL
jgi:hypothetical protein